MYMLKSTNDNQCEMKNCLLMNTYTKNEDDLIDNET